MNPALTPLSQIREMSNAELVAFAKEHSTLTILEREFLRRMDGVSSVPRDRLQGRNPERRYCKE